MSALIARPDFFSAGYHPITFRADETGMDFGVLTLAPGQSFDLTSELETACLLLTGKATFQYLDVSRVVQRESVFEQDPFCLHLSPRDLGRVEAGDGGCECVVVRTQHSGSFATTLFDATNMLESEKRGKGLLGDTAYRIVRTIFDGRNRPDAGLVLGEVITFPGRWSSYPPHHHPQPEIYHYRFTEPQGYGHGECGDTVYRIHDGDTLKILDGNDHAQVAAPGYGMMYVWAIRHLPDHPYTVPDFTPCHDWTRHPGADDRAWTPR